MVSVRNHPFVHRGSIVDTAPVVTFFTAVSASAAPIEPATLAIDDGEEEVIIS